MFKFILLLYVCVCVINCNKLKCDIKYIKDVQSSEIHDKTDFCKDKNCVLRMCTKPNTMIVKYKDVKIRPRCRAMDWVAKNINLDVSVYKDYSRNEHNFTYVVLYNKTLNKLTEERCLENRIFIIPLGEYSFLKDGSLRITSSGQESVLPSQDFFAEFRVSQMSDGKWVGPEVSIRKFIKDDDDNTQDTYQAIGMLISCVFLILVLVVYFMFEQLRERRYGKMVMAYIACFTATFALMATIRLGLNAGVLDGVYCRCISSMMYFSILATFFWLNVMSYEIWNTFRPKNKFRSPQSREHNRTFLNAALYAFGVPLLMLIVAVIIDEQELVKVRPNFEVCMNSSELHLYYYVPMTIILLVNVVLFVMTSYRLWQLKKGTPLNSTESRITRRNQNIFGLYLKLSMSTGIIWVIDVIGFYVSFYTYYSCIFNTYICFLGVIVFLVCVCNKEVLKLLSKRFAINSCFVNQSSLNTTAKQLSKKAKV